MRKRLDVGAVLAAAGLMSLAACASTGDGGEAWNGELEVHGTIREAMSGPGPGVVELSRAVGVDAWGIGVLGGAAGEVIVTSGLPYVARASAVDRVEVEARLDGRASWLALARVPAWRERVLEREVDLDSLADEVALLAGEEGWDLSRPVPFRVEGPVAGLEVHVVRGVCPRMGEVTDATAPYAAALDARYAQLVGLLAPGAAGVLVHHGDEVHAHAVVPAGGEGQAGLVAGHVDGGRVMAGATVFVPARER